MSSCQDIYNDARGNFEGILYSSMVAWLFLTVALLPPNEEREQRRRGCCSFLVPCLRGMTFCFEPCRPLLKEEDTEVANAAEQVGTCAATSFIVLFLLLQLVPVLALILGVVFFYPECPCSSGDACKCTLFINGIPVGSCSGAAIFFSCVCSLGALISLVKGAKALGVIQNARSYSRTQVGSDQEMV